MYAHLYSWEEYSRDVVHKGRQRLYCIRPNVVELSHELFGRLRCVCQYASPYLYQGVAAYLVTDCCSRKRQRFVGQKVPIICCRQLQTEIYNEAELESIKQEQSGESQRRLPSRFSHCVKLLYCACVSSPPLYPRTTPSKKPADIFETAIGVSG